MNTKTEATFEKVLTVSDLREKLLEYVNGTLSPKALADWALNIEVDDFLYEEEHSDLIAKIVREMIDSDLGNVAPALVMPLVQAKEYAEILKH